MADPKSMEEFAALALSNHRVSGYGIAGVTQHLPCPGCAAPDWKSYLVIEARERMAEPATCKACGRSFKVVFEQPEPGHTVFEFVQTGGDDIPDWYAPKIRRLE